MGIPPINDTMLRTSTNMILAVSRNLNPIFATAGSYINNVLSLSMECLIASDIDGQLFHFPSFSPVIYMHSRMSNMHRNCST